MFPYRPKACDSIAELVGNTPMVLLKNIGKELAGVQLLAKLEYFNPGGSVKDRPALEIVLDAQRSGALTKGKTLIDATSGNTGIAYSWIGAALGFPVALVVPQNVSIARKQISVAYGATLIYSDPMEGSDGAIRHVRQLVAQQPDRFFYADQYSNDSNPKAHELTTGKEIWDRHEALQAASATRVRFGGYGWRPALPFAPLGPRNGSTLNPASSGLGGAGIGTDAIRKGDRPYSSKSVVSHKAA